MSYQKYGREQNKVIICLFNHRYGHCFWDGEKQQKTTSTMTNNVSHSDYPKSPTTRHVSSSKQNCSQRHRALTVTIFPPHWGIFCHFFFIDILTDNDWAELVAIISTSIYIHIHISYIYIHAHTYISCKLWHGDLPYAWYHIAYMLCFTPHHIANGFLCNLRKTHSTYWRPSKYSEYCLLFVEQYSVCSFRILSFTLHLFRSY